MCAYPGAGVVGAGFPRVGVGVLQDLNLHLLAGKVPHLVPEPPVPTQGYLKLGPMVVRGCWV